MCSPAATAVELLPPVAVGLLPPVAVELLPPVAVESPPAISPPVEVMEADLNWWWRRPPAVVEGRREVGHGSAWQA